MFKIYDTQYNFIRMVDKCQKACITTSLDTGLKTFSFQLPVTTDFLQDVSEEYYLETADYHYVIKEINLKHNNMFEVFCKANIEDLKTLIPTFDAFDINVEAALQKAIENTGWKIKFFSQHQDMVNYKEAFKTPYELTELIKADYNLELYYNTKRKTIEVYDMIGKSRGACFTNELNLKELTRQGQSYEFYTVVYPIGKDGMTIGVVNNGKNFLENYSYCNKYLPKYLILDDIEHTEELKMAGQSFLDSHCAPCVSYQVSAAQLPSDLTIGDNIMLIDRIKRIKQKQRVVKIIHYPFEPEKDKIELSNQLVSFTNIFWKTQTTYNKQIQYIKNNLKTLK